MGSEVITEVADLNKLPAGWDGYSSEVIDLEIIRAAMLFVGSVPVALDIGTPDVVPISDGRFQLEWHGDNASRVGVHDAASLHFLRYTHGRDGEKWRWSEPGEVVETVEGQERQEEECQIPLSDAPAIWRLVQWFNEQERSDARTKTDPDRNAQKAR